MRRFGAERAQAQDILAYLAVEPTAANVQWLKNRIDLIAAEAREEARAAIYREIARNVIEGLKRGDFDVLPDVVPVVLKEATP